MFSRILPVEAILESFFFFFQFVRVPSEGFCLNGNHFFKRYKGDILPGTQIKNALAVVLYR